MSLVQRSFVGAVMIMVILIVRGLTIHKLPKKVYLVLWGIVILRLLIPFSMVSSLSVYSIIHNRTASMNNENNDSISKIIPVAPKKEMITVSVEQNLEKSDDMNNNQEKVNETNPVRTVFTWKLVWILGAVVCILVFGGMYIRCRFLFRESFPVKNEYIDLWLKQHPLHRTITVHQTDRITSPLTYGILRPVILLSKYTDWENEEQLQYILSHEYIHICRFDAVRKLFLLIVLCIHWFNPFVWLMYRYANRDIELYCDERVIHRFGEHNRIIYAKMLLDMAETRHIMTPLSSNFSKSAIQERIKAIVKCKKATVFTVFIAAALIVVITICFATSCKADKEKLDPVANTEFSKEEYDMLDKLRFDGYEELSIAQYQKKVWEITDNAVYDELLERFYQDNTLYEQANTNETASFIFHILLPLTKEKWQSSDFGDMIHTNSSNAANPAYLEYEFTLNILDPNELTVKQYNDTRIGIMHDISKIIEDRTEEELEDALTMNEMIQPKLDEIIKKWQRKELDVVCKYFMYQPFVYDDQNNIQKQWEDILAPYEKFGLSYEYIPDSEGNGLKMYYKGKEVRGIYDDQEGEWITEHAGISTYSADAVELYTVYDNGTLVGLRFASKEEQEEFTKQREQATAKNEENTYYEPESATQVDYESVFTLMSSDYEKMTVNDFNQKLLDWANVNYESMERIGFAVSNNSYSISLTEREQAFLETTFTLSREENTEMIRSVQSGKAEEDPIHMITLPQRQLGEYSWCDFWFQFTYHITDPAQITVEERDKCIRGMIDDVQEYYDTCTNSELIKMKKSDVISYIEKTMEKYNNQKIKISIYNEQVGFENNL
ncbi:M56 family metallopeptidase [Anaerosporobacter faecicola]|uniref:M56 family metallopeptidase n=1 Tax=Anaerosporobacter faecicola TaxID=2718714 RepID=UPI00143BF612|nr:M56 family metallopeptidase [Anaerosporobacter faecicola]